LVTARPRPTPRHTADCLAQIDQLTKRLRLLEPIMRRQAAGSGPDGYSSTSGPSDRGNHRGGYSDPVGNLVAKRLDDPRADVLVNAHTEMLAKIHRARALLAAAEVAARAE
jgi:hypothetical protein